MDVREVDHRVGVVGSGSEDVEVVELAPPHLGPDGGDRRSGGVGARQADDVVTGSDELGDDRPSDESGSSGDEDAHGVSPRVE